MKNNTSCFKRVSAQDGVHQKELDELTSKADVLQKMLCQRLKDHIGTRAMARKDHWVWKFSLKNLIVVASFMILAGHTKPRIACISEGGSLLSPDVNKFAPCEMSPEPSTNNGMFIRSGKVTGRGVQTRLMEHKSCAVAKLASSNFYGMYPSEISSRSERRDKKGCFEDLLLLGLIQKAPVLNLPVKA
mmetsp:Transcript_6858/g.10236  ORF Transcript_6858/g.10236 Transcript_6858/m.10236 type:complete len:188 (+) Transcript_6858:92-655(+)